MPGKRIKCSIYIVERLQESAGCFAPGHSCPSRLLNLFVILYLFGYLSRGSQRPGYMFGTIPCPPSCLCAPPLPLATRRLPDRPVSAGRCSLPPAPISPQGAPLAPRRHPIQVITRRPPRHSAPSQLIGDLLVAKPANSVSSWLFHSLPFRCSAGEAAGSMLSE